MVYHFGWWDCDGIATEAAPGKGLRPALVLAAARAMGGTIEAARHAAAAVELVHNFTLIQDDVMDADAVRRGRPAVWRVWGATDAILAGDALHALAVWTIADAPCAVSSVIMRLEGAVIELCLGQHQDCVAETRAQVSPEECLEILLHKTGALFGCACALGALCADAPPDAVAALDRFGRELGLAFQLVDDLIGIWGDPARTGKPVGGDLLRRKRSLPVAAALSSATPAGRELAELYAADRPLSVETIVHVADLIDRAGGKDWARAEAVSHFRAARACLADFTDTADLVALADRVIHRDR